MYTVHGGVHAHQRVSHDHQWTSDQEAEASPSAQATQALTHTQSQKYSVV